MNTGKYIYFDKYLGRSLSVDGFKRNLLQYLNNGLKIRTDAIDPIIEKLESLYKSIQSKSAYRFYGSSLLVLYDGYDASTDQEKNIDVRMIDFAHSTHIGYKQDHKVHNGPDQGYLFGLENLIKIFNEIKNDCLLLSNTAALQDSKEQTMHEVENNKIVLANNSPHICFNPANLATPPDP